MLTDIEKSFLKKLFFDDSISKKEIKSLEKEAKNNEEHFWSTLYNFIIEHRISSIMEDDELLDFYLFNVAPSCVYPTNKLYYCKLCDIKYKKTAYLVRHYREKHFFQIPREVFGPESVFNCEPCNSKFSRKEYYTQHLNSEFHKNRVDPNRENEEPTIEKKNHIKERREKETTEWESKRLKVEKNCNQFSPKTIYTSDCSNDSDIVHDEDFGTKKKSNDENFKNQSDFDNESEFTLDSDASSEDKVLVSRIGNYGLLKLKSESEKEAMKKNDKEMKTEKTNLSLVDDLIKKSLLEIACNDVLQIKATTGESQIVVKKTKNVEEKNELSLLRESSLMRELKDLLQSDEEIQTESKDGELMKEIQIYMNSNENPELDVISKHPNTQEEPLRILSQKLEKKLSILN